MACTEKRRRMCSKSVMVNPVIDVRGEIMRGRPKRRWLDNARNDLSERKLSGEEAQYRMKWKRLIRNIHPK